MFGMAGMESQLAVAILLASMFYLIARRTVPLGITLALCLYARPDFIVWVVIAGSFFTWWCWREKRLRPPILVAFLVLMIYGPWVIFAAYYYGTFMPHSIIAKMIGYRPASAGDLLIQLFTPLGPSFGGHGTGFVPLSLNKLLIAITLILAIARLIFDLIGRRYLLPIFVYQLAYTIFVFFSFPWVFGWYTVPFAAVWAVLAGKGLGDIFSLLPRHVRSWKLGFASFTILIPYLAVLPMTFEEQRVIQQYVENGIRKQIGLYLRHVSTPTQTIGGEPLGYIGYYSRLTYYDFPGLCSKRVVAIEKKLLQEKCATCPKPKNIVTMMRVMSEIKPNFLVLRRKELEWSMRHPEGQFIKLDYREQKWFRISDQGRSLMLFPKANQDMEYVVLTRIQ